LLLILKNLEASTTTSTICHGDTWRRKRGVVFLPLLFGGGGLFPFVGTNKEEEEVVDLSVIAHLIYHYKHHLLLLSPPLLLLLVMMDGDDDGGDDGW